MARSSHFVNVLSKGLPKAAILRRESERAYKGIKMLSWFTAREVIAPTALEDAEALELRVRVMKEDALARAARRVADGVEPPAYEDKPGMSHYLRAMRELCDEYATPLPMRARLDLSQVVVRGFAFTDEDFARAEAEMTAEERAELELGGTA